ncbi:RNA-binding S4 domain-containing protein [Stappia sp.]|uniref:RNA-binding S4 domain-containing protein n=1 Tax=Stappia sp. TaxID=1870903 RepID=UPI003A9982EB
MGAGDDKAPATGAGTQRLDKWLWFARVVKSRSLAQKLVASGHVRVNREKTTTPAKTVRPGDTLTIAVADRVRTLKIVLPGTRRGPAPEAATLYELVEQQEPSRPAVTRVTDEGETVLVVDGPPAGRRDPGAGRPTKRDRRQTDRLRDDWPDQG